MQQTELILASASPRRQELLVNLGLNPVVRPQELDETAGPDENPRELALRLAAEKCRQAASRLEGGRDRIVLAADTVVVVGNTVLGKPRDRGDAGRMLELLRGRTHQVLTAVSLHRTTGGRQIDRIETTAVRFHELDRRWIDWYLATGEPLDKAGAYGIQGLGAVLVHSISGSWSNVVGLPVEMLPGWLQELGLDFRDLAGQPTRAP